MDHMIQITDQSLINILVDFIFFLKTFHMFILKYLRCDCEVLSWWLIVYFCYFPWEVL